MTDPKPMFTIPPIACLFGEREHVARLLTKHWQTGNKFVEGTLLLAADAAAKAIHGRTIHDFKHLSIEMGEGEHQATRASLHAFLMANSPEVVANAFWSAVEHRQRQELETHEREQKQYPNRPPERFEMFTIVLHLDSEAEFALIKQRAPGAVAIEIVDRHPQSEGTQNREGWPTRITRIGSRPDEPAWASGLPDQMVGEFRGAWAALVRARIRALASQPAAHE